MGTLRLRHCELLDAFGTLLLEEPDLFSASRNKSIQSFVRTCAAVNYCPTTLPTLVERHLKVEEKSSDDSDPSTEIRNRIDLVWSLSILDQANMNHVATVLQQDLFQHVQSMFIDTSAILLPFRFSSSRSEQLKNSQCLETADHLFAQFTEVLEEIPQANI